MANIRSFLPTCVLTFVRFTVSVLCVAFFCGSSLWADYDAATADLGADWTVTNANGVTLDGSVLSSAKHTGALTISSDPTFTLTNGAVFEQNGKITSNKYAIVVQGGGTLKITSASDLNSQAKGLWGFYFYDGSVVDTSGAGFMCLNGTSNNVRFYEDGELIIGTNMWTKTTTEIHAYSGANAKLTQSTAGGISNDSGLNLSTSGSVTFNVEENATLTSTAKIYDEGSTGSIAKTGAGSLTLSGSLTYNVPTTVSDGTLLFSCETLPVSAMSATGGTLVIGTEGKDITVKRNSSIKASGGAVRVDGDLVFESPGSGFVACDGSWTGSGTITLDGGYIRVGTNFNTTTGINFNGGSILNNNNAAVLSSDLTITKDGSTMQAGWEKTLTLTGALKGDKSLTVGSDSGWLIFNGNGSAYTGSLLVKGKMQIGAANKDSSDVSEYIGGKVINLNGGTIKNNNNNLTFTNDLNVMSETGFQSGWSKSITLTGNVTGSAKLKLVSDSGWLILKTHSDGDSFTGPFQTGWASTSKRGQMRLAADQPLGANCGVLYNYGYLDMNGFSQKFKGVVDDGANNKLGRIYNTTGTKSVVTFDITSQNLSYAGTIESNVELIVNASGAGTQTFTNGGSSFTGNATINGGTLRMTGKGSGGNSPIGLVSDTRSVYVNSGGELVFGNQDVLKNAHNYAPINFVVDGGKISNDGAFYNFLQNTTFKNGGQLYASDGSATWKAFKLLNVTIARNDDDTAGAPVLFSSDPSKPDATIAFGDISSVIEAGNSVSTVDVAEITSADKSVNDNVSDLVISSVIADPVYKTDGALKNATEIVKTGAGTMEFTAANTYTGKTSVTEGALRLTDDAVATHGLLSVDEEGTLEFNISDNQTKKLTVSSANAISSTGSLVKIGEGTLQIDASTPDLVNASLMRVSSGRLDMKEYFTGVMEVETGATLSPGNSIGSLTINGDFNLNGGTLLMEVEGPTAAESDQLFVTGGSLNLSEGSTILLDFINGMSPNAEFAVVIDAPNSNENWVNYVDASYVTDLSYALTGGRWVLSGRIDPNAVPEPSTWALLALGVIVLFLRKRVRN